MKKLLKMFRSLPPEMRMMLAMAGMGSPIGAIYLLRRFLFPGVKTIYLIFGVAAVIAVIALLGFLFSRVFGARGRKRQKKMEADMAGGTESGPSGMEVRAQIKANNEKFFNAIRDMRKDTGISVYDLPWYIVIGDSGCGKTKLINEGGLVFSRGRPEGYQLGTLDYNFWFTEDAVFVDMAGRLCNPQEDSDRREWTSFLETLANGRKGFPINGAIVCVSAEHLLEDSPEKVEQDANTVLERLRDLQSKLGVTFATYMVITKCDKILGFMQLFDRASHDVTIKKQIFGWSKPTEFNELYDPDAFDGDFDSIYERLNDLRLRRLNDDVDETELGLAYSFPEEFRTLKEPVHTYVRTLFPMVKNPKAMKNLIFRGIYFTSATQEGGVILKHLAERLGEEAASQFAPLESLYPQPTPHFVRDLLFKKVFPEYGLVFRNEAQVARHRRLAKFAKVGGLSLAVALVAALTWSFWSFSNLIGAPRDDAVKLVRNLEDGESTPVVPETALQDSVRLAAHVRTLQEHPVVRTILSGGIGADRPIQDLSMLEVRLFEAGPLRKALHDVDQALRTAERSTDQERDKYRKALKQYVAWYGCSKHDEPHSAIDYDGFRKELCAIVTDEDSIIRNEDRDTFFDEAKRYFTTIASLEGAKNPSRLLRGKNGFKPIETIRIAIANAHEDLSVYALLKSTHPDPRIAEWMRIAENCATAHAGYEAMVGAAEPSKINTVAQLDAFTKNFSSNFETFGQALDGCAWRSGKNTKRIRIPSLAEAIKDTRKHWTSYEKALTGAYKQCGSPPDEGIPAAIKWIREGNPEPGGVLGLDHVLFESLKKEVHLLPPDTEYGPDYFDDILEVYKHYAHTIDFKKAADAGGSDAVSLTAQAQGVRITLDVIHKGLARGPEAAAARPLTRWADDLKGYRRLPDNQPDPVMEKLVAKLHKAWLPSKLQELSGSYKILAHRGKATALLQSMEKQLGRAMSGRNRWGLGELAANWQKPQSSAYVILTEVRSDETPVEPDLPVDDQPPDDDDPFNDPFSAKETQLRRPSTPAIPAAGAGGTKDIPACATATFLIQRADECVRVLFWLNAIRPALYFTTEGAGDPLHERCRTRLQSSWKKYTEAYVSAWDRAYQQKKIGSLDKLSDHPTWSTFANQFSRRDIRGKNIETVRRELIPALRQILRNVRWGLFGHKNQGWVSMGYGDAVAEQRKFVYDTFDAAMGAHWKQGEFVKGAIHAGNLEPDAQPWNDLSASFSDRWATLAETIGRNADLRDKFDRQPKPNETAMIPWPDIDALRNDRNLSLIDEKLTGQLARFVKKGQSLLDTRLTEILTAIEERHLPKTATPYDGWPYVNEQGEGEHAMDTVPYEGFKSFLVETDYGRAYLEPLEKNLPAGSEKSKSKSRREVFHEQGKAWRTFMRLSEEGRNTLEITVTGWDPVGEEVDRAGKHSDHDIQDTPQHFYNDAALFLGLQTADGDEEALKISSQTDRRREEGARKLKWKWQAAGNRNLWFNLLDPVPGISNEPFPKLQPRTLGTSSPLALPAYLHRYGKFHAQAGGYWTTAHAIELNQVIEAVKIPDKARGQTKVGMKFKFELDRSMPGPIRPIGR